MGSGCESCQAKPLQRLDCLAAAENMRKVCFPKKQQRITSSEIEPVDSNLSISNPTLFQMICIVAAQFVAMRRRHNEISILQYFVLNQNIELIRPANVESKIF